jgi:hypothetical protein
MIAKPALLRFLARTPVRTFVLAPIAVAAFEFAMRGRALIFDPLGLPLLAWGYLQYGSSGATALPAAAAVRASKCRRNGSSHRGLIALRATRCISVT